MIQKNVTISNKIRAMHRAPRRSSLDRVQVQSGVWIARKGVG